jgi:Cation transport ATPase
VLAMKEADCSVSMVSGSDAARSASEFVLMTGDFSAMIEVLKEGRRVINNIESVAALYLVKTIYSLILGLSYCFIPFPYPFMPAQMMPVNGLTVGAPSFVLALRNNFARPTGRFFANVMEHSLPGAIAVVANALIIQLAGLLFEIPHSNTSSMTVLLTGLVGFLVLYTLSDSNKLWLKVFIGAMGVVFILCTLPIPLPVIGPASLFFLLEGIWTRNVFFWIPLTALSFLLFQFLNRSIVLLGKKLATFRSRWKARRENA